MYGRIDNLLYDLPLSDVLEKAKTLGWKEPDLPGTWDATTADALQADAIDFILKRGEASPSPPLSKDSQLITK